jgi:FlaA1/EpsC-like NDP-sugar epimerase
MISRLAKKLTLLPNALKQGIISLSDTVVLCAAVLLAFLVGVGGIETFHAEPRFVDLLVLVLAGPAVAFASLRMLGVHRVVTRYLGIDLVERCFIANGIATVTLLLALVLSATALPALQIAFLFGLLGFSATLLTRVTALKILRRKVRRHGAKPVLIYGAGDAGSQLAAALRDGAEFLPVAFVDDSRCRQGRTVQGLKVHCPQQLKRLKEELGFERVLLAMPTATRERRRRILEEVEALAVKVLAMPSLGELAVGNRRVDDLREVQIEDLLARDPVPAVPELLTGRIAGKSVLITGAGGSIGSELARQVLAHGARRLVLMDVSEYSLYAIDHALRRTPGAAACEIIPVLGSVLDEALLARTFRQHQVQTVYHAAAYKHVPLVEANLLSALVNNVQGTLRTVQAALAASVECFVLVSTDKAVRPTNVMGASKRVCELIVQALAQVHPHVAMSMVRFGNVLASSGSVVPLFRDQIAAGGPVTVTHPEVTRYFMTIPEAAQLVLQAGGMGENGEVFLLEMGEPVLIRQLAERMIHLSGLTVRDAEHPQGDVEIRFTGLRPGEKLFEELLIADNPLATAHARIFKAQESAMSWSVLSGLLDQLTAAAQAEDELQALALLGQMVTGFDRKLPAAATSSAPASDRVVYMPGRTGEFHRRDLAASSSASDKSGSATADEAAIPALGYG